MQGKEKLDFEDINKEYNPWVVNQAMSYYLDTVLFAAEMNKVYFLDRQMQYDFLFYAIKKKKRKYVPWVKKVKESDDISVIKEVYQISNKKANEILNILTSDQLETLRTATNKGGK